MVRKIWTVIEEKDKILSAKEKENWVKEKE